jgi:Sensors of blue-light using FAD
LRKTRPADPSFLLDKPRANQEIRYVLFGMDDRRIEPHIDPKSTERASGVSVIRLMYRSENAMNVTGGRLLVHFHDIVATARRHNAAADIDGFLMFDRTRFHQILEGPEDRVDVLFAKIQSDTRHRNIECLAREVISKRNFAEWSMGSFLNDQVQNAVKVRHGIRPNAALDYEPFLRFALDFVAMEPVEK